VRVETWRIIPGYQGLYEVSDHGRVRSLDRVVQRGDVRQPRRGVVLSPGWSHDGYALVVLADVAHRRRTWRVHQLVLLAFVGPRPEGHEGLHADGNPGNNIPSNLSWGTSAENRADTIRHGRANGRGEKHAQAKLSAKQVENIRAELARGVRGSVVASTYGMSPSQISDIKNNRAWRACA